MIIAFMGNDGSGKTTIAKEFVKIFRDFGFEVIYRHEYHYTILRFLFRIIGMKKIESERKKMIVEKKDSWKYRLWPFLVWFDVFYSFVCFKLFKRKAIVILDRYLYDHYVSFEYLGCLTRFSDWLYVHSPRPDIGFVLWVEPQIAYLRKKSTHSYSLSFYTEQTKRYIELIRRLRMKSINTNKSVRETVNEIFKAMPKDKLALIFKKGMQNKILFSVIEKHRITSIYPLIIGTWQERKKKLERTLMFVKDFFEKNGIKYCIIKTFCSERWIGNDVDILVSNKEFSRIVAILKEGDTHNVVVKQRTMDKGKVDVKLPNCLAIDLHSYIGWRNVVFIPTEHAFNKDWLIKKEAGLCFANEKFDSIIIILTHIFEKGFITLDEYEFLMKHFDESFMRTNFPYLYVILGSYISWIRRTLMEEQNRSYPLFVPLHVILKCYLKLLFHSKYKQGNVLWKFKAFIRDISFMIFWRTRYTLRNKLPFEVKMGF